MHKIKESKAGRAARAGDAPRFPASLRAIFGAVVFVTVGAVGWAGAGCTPPPPDAVKETAAADVTTASAAPIAAPGPAAAVTPTFANKVWKVSKSPDSAPGTLYTFLSEGTLVIASPKSKPALGTWAKKDKGLVMVEEGQSYRVEILGLTDREFRLRMFNPGKPTDITLVPG